MQRHSRVSGVILPSSYRVIVMFVVLASTVNTAVRVCKCVYELALSAHYAADSGSREGWKGGMKNPFSETQEQM